MIYIYPYKLGSDSAKKLREGLSSKLRYRVKMVKPDGRFRPRRDDIVINWGSSTLPRWKMSLEDIQTVASIANASNKLTAFKLFKEHNVTIPNWTESIEEAREFFTRPDSRVLCRTILNGHSGRGIIVANSNTALVEAPLYVAYKKKKHEFRVHVFNGKVIDVQQKRKREGFRDNEAADTIIRNHHTGWVYCRENLAYTDELGLLACKAVKALGLNFGAVDIIYNERENQYYVLEVNTAPGLDGTTVNNYVEAIYNAI